MPENYTLAVIDFIRLFYAKVKLKSQFVLKDIISSALTICMKADKLSEDFKTSLSGLFANMHWALRAPVHEKMGRLH